MAGLGSKKLRILAIEDDPIMHVILRSALSGMVDGDLNIAATGAEGLTAAESMDPELILLDLFLPDMGGEEVIQRLREQEGTKHVPVIFLTGAVRDLDEDKLRAWSVAGVIEKPFNPADLVRQVETAMLAGEADANDAAATIDSIREALLKEGGEVTAGMLARLADGEIDLEQTASMAHLWAGRGGTLGFPRISELARSLGEAIRIDDLDEQGIYDLVEQLHEFFVSGPSPEDPSAPASNDDASSIPFEQTIGSALAGKRIALIGLGDDGGEAASLREVLDDIDAFYRVLERGEHDRLERFDLIICRLDATLDDIEGEIAAMLDAGPPCLLIGPRELFAARKYTAGQHDFLVAPWKVDELLLRAQHLFMATPARAAAGVSAERERALVVIADDDAAIASLIAATLAGDNIECLVASDGAQALQTTIDSRPDALVLDVNMPGLDGFEVLSRVKSDAGTAGISVLMLTARRHEADIVRGFRLGADDYMIKPFNPTELLVRLTRLMPAGR